MPKIAKTAFINISLRGLTLASKFILLLNMARLFTTAELGIYGLFTTTIGLFLYLAGIDFYMFSSREILAHPRIEWSRLIRDQFLFYVVTYLLVIPITTIVFIGGFLPWKYLIWFNLLLVLEHLGREVYRALLILSQPVIANIALFLQNGIWVYALLTLMCLRPETRNLTTLWLVWAVGIIVSLVFEVYWLRDLDWQSAIRTSVDWAWIKQGISVSLPLLGGTLTALGITVVDRYGLKLYWGSEAVGIYTFYASLANTLQGFIDTGVITIFYPQIVATYQQGLEKEYRQLMNQLTRIIALLALILSALAIAFIYPVLALVHKPIYAANLPVYWVLLASAIVTVFGLIPHYGLYAKRLDKAIISSNIVGLLVAVLVNLLLVPKFGSIGAAFATLSGMTVMGTVKLSALNKRRMV